jgi:hypothetical protein
MVDVPLKTRMVIINNGTFTIYIHHYSHHPHIKHGEYPIVDEPPDKDVHK